MPRNKSEIGRKHCKHCNQTFNTTIKRQIFCGSECRVKHNYKKYSLGEYGRKYRAKYRKKHGIVKYNIGDLKQCNRCGEQFVLTENSRKICELCKERAQNKKHSCRWCGDLFVVGRRTMYCSDECAFKRRRQQQRDYERNKALAKGITKRGNPRDKQCKWCGSDFSIMKDGSGYKYCSKTCARESFNDYSRKYMKQKRGKANGSCN